LPFNMTVYNRTRRRAEDLERLGATADPERVITMAGRLFASIPSSAVRHESAGHSNSVRPP